MKWTIRIICTLSLCWNIALGQDSARIHGTIYSEDGSTLPEVSIFVNDASNPSGKSDIYGKYAITIEANKNIKVVFYYSSTLKETKTLNLKPGENRVLKISINTTHTFESHVVTEERDRDMTKIRWMPTAPSPGGQEFTKMLIGEIGVNINNELSSGYSVRGGNFDENLVYVNGIEVYRPFLARAGEQEGLSFVNGDMVDRVTFSAGGFDAKYGDKLSSVLDIRYRRPTETAGGVTLSLLGGSGFFQGVSKNELFRHITGVRYRSNAYVLGSLDTKGDYKPSFTDVQTYMTYNLGENLELNFLGNYSKNKFNFIPQNRSTNIGTISEVIRLSVYFEGQEITQYETFTGALSANWRATKNTDFQFTTSLFKTYEEEKFDVLGEYWLDEVENDFGSDEFGEAVSNIGVGGYLNHSRNLLDAAVGSFDFKGNTKFIGKTFEINPYEQKSFFSEILYGAKFQVESIYDELSEWNLIDSAGYSLPHPKDSVGYTTPSSQPAQIVELSKVYKSDNHLISNRYQGYLQYNANWNNRDSLGHSSNVALHLGGRVGYWDVNEQLLLSPRGMLTFRPNWKNIYKDKKGNDSIVKKDIQFKLATGVYYQPPFYRELRDFQGNINLNVRAQKSMHLVLGVDWNFNMWGRNFKFISEAFYKRMDDVIPYEIDNVRIRYYADNLAKAYATGIDFKINGQFIKDIESWASLSIMQVREDLKNDFYYDYFNESGEQIVLGVTPDDTPTDSLRVEPGWIPRPTDQRFNFSLFFQDHMPGFEQFKVHVNMQFGGRLPFGPPDTERYKDTLRTPPYKRVDIGFSYDLLAKRPVEERKPFFKKMKDLSLSFEVFNLLDIRNTVSHLWVSDINARRYAIPNYLTGRRLNLKLIARF